MRPGFASAAWFAALRSFAALVLGAFLFAASLRAAQDEPPAHELLEQLLGEDRSVRDAAFERWLAQSSPADPRLAAALALHSERAWTALRRMPVMAEVKSLLKLRERLEQAQRTVIDLLATPLDVGDPHAAARRERRLESALQTTYRLAWEGRVRRVDLMPRPAALLAILRWNARACERAGLPADHGALRELLPPLLLMLDETPTLTLADLPRNSTERTERIERRLDDERRRSRISGCSPGMIFTPDGVLMSRVDRELEWDRVRGTLEIAPVRRCTLGSRLFALARARATTPQALLELVERGDPLVLDALLKGAFPFENGSSRAPAADLRVVRVARVPVAVLDDLDATLDWLRLHPEHVAALLDPTFTSGDVLELDGELLILAARR
ncbi:MAG: hypothetical protein JNN27_21250 [Planctomycetes bacterium]|nr:hypothetical protein [Planctomycetota bacterium]